MIDEKQGHPSIFLYADEQAGRRPITEDPPLVIATMATRRLGHHVRVRAYRGGQPVTTNCQFKTCDRPARVSFWPCGSPEPIFACDDHAADARRDFGG